jgi:hypothetical protein
MINHDGPGVNMKGKFDDGSTGDPKVDPRTTMIDDWRLRKKIFSMNNSSTLEVNKGDFRTHLHTYTMTIEIHSRTKRGTIICMRKTITTLGLFSDGGA